MTTHPECSTGFEAGLVWLTDYVRELAAKPGETPDGIRAALWYGGVRELVPIDSRDDSGSCDWPGGPAGRVAAQVLFGPRLDDGPGDSDLLFRRADLDAVLGRLAEESTDPDVALGRDVRTQRAKFGKRGSDEKKRRAESYWAPLIEECRALKEKNPSLTKSDAACKVAKRHPPVNANTLRRKL